MMRSETPIMLIRPDVAAENLRELRKMLGFCRPSIFYAVKANRTPQIIEALARADAGFMVTNEEELKLVKGKGSIRMICVHYSKGLIRLAERLDVKSYVVDSFNQAALLADTLEKKQNKAMILCRISIGMQGGLYREQNHLGMSVQEAQLACSMLQKKGFRTGLHAHCSSQNIELGKWKKQIEVMQSALEAIEGIDEIDMGGGFPVDYNNIQTDVHDIIKGIKSDLQSLGKNCELSFEPGRYIVADAVQIKSRILAVKEKCVIIDFSCYSGWMDSMLTGLEPVCEGSTEGKGCREFAVKGITLDSLDVVGTYNLKHPKVGDVLVFKNVGAYCFGSDFGPKLEKKIIGA